MRKAQLLCLLAVFSAMIACGSRGQEYDRYQLDNGHFRIQVQARNGMAIYYPGATLLFLSSPVVEAHWVKIMEVEHDDPVPIPRGQVCFIDDRSAFVYFTWHFAITRDGGTTWSVWDAEEDLQQVRGINYRYIEDVSITADGKGLMRPALPR